MYACICHAVAEAAIFELAAGGASAEAVAEATRAGTSCGSCSETVAALVERAGGARVERPHQPGGPACDRSCETPSGHCRKPVPEQRRA